MGHGIPSNMPQPYGRSAVAEIHGGDRANKAQLIVGIDFGTTFSGVAFAFATNSEAREDIITEWPGAGTHTKQKVSACEMRIWLSPKWIRYRESFDPGGKRGI